MKSLSPDSFEHYHFLWWCHRQHYLRLKRIRTCLTALALTVVSTGTLLGPIFANVWITASLTLLTMLIKGWMDYRRYDSLIALSRFAYTTYAKFLTPLTTPSASDIICTHHLVIDLAPVLPDSIRRAYLKDDLPRTCVDGTELVKIAKKKDQEEHGTTPTQSRPSSSSSPA